MKQILDSRDRIAFPSILGDRNAEGGHGAGVTSEQRARMQAVTFAYLWERLGR